MFNRIAFIATVSAALIAAPIGLTSQSGVSQALAKSEGGNGGGHEGKDGRDGKADNDRGKSDNGRGKAEKAGDDRGRAAKSDGARDRAQANRSADRDRSQSARAAEVRSNDRAKAEARGKAANELGNLNAAHASANARAHASPNSMVGRIGTYEARMNSALAIKDPVARNAAITSARGQLAQSANKPLTPSAVARVDGLLGIKGAPTDLGTVH